MFLQLLAALACPLAFISIALIGCGQSRPQPAAQPKNMKKKKGGQKHRHSTSSSKHSKKSKSSKRSKKSKGREPEEDYLIKLPKKPGGSSMGYSGARKEDYSSRSQKASSWSMESAVNTEDISSKIGEELKKYLTIEPAELLFPPEGGMQKVRLTNTSSERRALKIKCTDNRLYRVNPVFSFIEPGQELGVDVLRENGGAKSDKMVFITAKATEGDKKPREYFKRGDGHPMVVLPLIAVQ